MIWESLPELITKRMRLRWLTEADVDALYRIFSHPQVVRYWGAPALPNRESATALLAEIQENFRKRTSMKWGVAELETDKVIGTVTLFNLNLDNKRAEIGYAMNHNYWRKGYVTEALDALLSYAFDELQLHRLEADVDPRNVGSIRTLEKMGFQREGLLRERWQVNGEIQDAVFYGLLRPEWEAGSKVALK
ncbi:MAG TPA: GNAT family protein [Pyrinomonadaceae bacterium]